MYPHIAYNDHQPGMPLPECISAEHKGKIIRSWHVIDNASTYAGGYKYTSISISLVVGGDVFATSVAYKRSLLPLVR